MEISLRLKVLDCIGKIFDESKECRLEESFILKVDAELSFLSEPDNIVYTKWTRLLLNQKLQLASNSS